MSDAQGSGTTQNTGTETADTSSQATEATITATAAAASTEDTTATSADSTAAAASADTTKTDEGKTDDGKKGADDATKAGAPESYEFTAPEGHTLDEGFVSEYSEAARALDMPQESAQKLLDHMIPKMQERAAARAAEIREGWANEARADKEFGGENLDANLAIAKRAQDALGTPALKQFLEESGLGNHPEIIRTFFRAGKQLSEDKFVTSESGTQNVADVPAHKRLYPDQA